MKITQLQPQKRDPDRFNLYVDGDFLCGISVDALAKFLLYEGREITEDELSQVTQFELFNRFNEQVLGYLSRGLKTQKQIERYIQGLAFKKRGKWFAQELPIELSELTVQIVENLKRNGYINDRSFAQAFIQSRLHSRPRSKSVLEMELSSKGVDRETAKSIVGSLVEDELELARQAYEKRYKGAPFLFKERKKIDYLRRKGFSWDIISKLIDDDVRD